MLLFGALVLIQGVHVFEHVVQLLQVTVFGVPDDDALGLLGYVFAIQGTEEWLHLVFNSLYLLGLYALLPGLWRRFPAIVPPWALAAYVAGVTLESWHIAEHAVIISHVVANGGCPCPGIGDARLGVSDTYLHFFYNVSVYAAVVATFWRTRRSLLAQGRLVDAPPRLVPPSPA
jgi:hypothetical protein